MNERDRRREARWVPRDPELVRARIRAGCDATVLNCSPRGVCVASPMRLLLGRRCTVSWPQASEAPSATGAVVRSRVGQVEPSAVVYYVAVEFEPPAEFLRERATPDG